MVSIPVNRHTTKNLIEEKGETKSKPRPYLGMSSTNAACARSLWYGFHWVSSKIIPARIIRIFERGDWEEQRIIRDLKSIGVECFRRDSDGNKIEIFGLPEEEQEEIIGFAGHCKGHNDGRGLNIPEAPKTEHLLEFKSANDKNFKKFVKLGVEKAHPVYYGQVQRYMKGFGLTRTLFVVTNKNDEERYYERIKYDKEFASELERREQHIILSPVPLEKLSQDPTWFECKFCNNIGPCHYGESPNLNCRTCDHSDLIDGGKWVCSIDESEISIAKQRVGCDLHRIGWGL